MQILCLLTVFILLIAGVYYAWQYFQTTSHSAFEVSVNPVKIIFETDEKFLSVGLDSSFMGCIFHNFSKGDWKKFEQLSKLLSPAYLRLGGTYADLTVFNLNEKDIFVNNNNNNNNCVDVHPNKTIIINGSDWIKINEFVKNSGFSFIIDLNVLLRSDSVWNSSNAKSLIRFSEQNGFQLDFQLGNEPNSFFHVFNVEISPEQLAKDFYTLRKILKSTKAYQKSKLIGPDVTQPKNLGEEGLKYLRNFLNKDVVDAASWHQYYLNGRTATLEDFVDPKTFDLLPPVAESVVTTVRKFSPTLPIWLSETSSAYGGGAPKLSNRFAASFLWLDKLGIAARSGISVVIRHTLYKNHYALISDKFIPYPDFWISLLYKKLVGTRVLDVHANDGANDVRLYAHCLASNSGVNGNIVIYGVNLKNETEFIDLQGLNIEPPIRGYIFKPELYNLRAKSVLLNDILLIYNETEIPDLVNMSTEVELPLVFHSQSIAFWVLKARETACGLL